MRNIKKAYLEGHNIMELLRDEKSDGNTINSILYSYDLQAGSYTAFFYNTEIQESMIKVIINGSTVEVKRKLYLDEFAKCAADILDSLQIHNFIEVGVGEATTLCNVLKHMKTKLSFSGGG